MKVETLQLTDDIRLQGFGHQASRDLQVFRGALPHLQAAGHAHALQHLDVVVDLKHAVKVEQILKPAGERTGGENEDAGSNLAVHVLTVSRWSGEYRANVTPRS